MKSKLTKLTLSIILTLTIISLAVVLQAAVLSGHPCTPYSGNYRLHDFGD